MSRISPKNPRIGGIQERTAGRCGGERRGRHSRCMGCAAIASHNASISRRRSLGSPSTTPCPKLRRAHPSRPASQIHRYTRYLLLGEQRERARGNNDDDRACSRTCVRDSYYLSRYLYYEREREREGQQCTHAVSCDTIYREWIWKRTPALLRCFSVIEGEMRRANKQGSLG